MSLLREKMLSRENTGRTPWRIQVSRLVMYCPSQSWCSEKQQTKSEGAGKKASQTPPLKGSSEHHKSPVPPLCCQCPLSHQTPLMHQKIKATDKLSFQQAYNLGVFLNYKKVSERIHDNMVKTKTIKYAVHIFNLVIKKYFQ